MPPTLKQRSWPSPFELRSGSYRPGAHHSFEIFEPKRRVVAAAPFRDRVVHHAICRVIEPIWERRFIADTCACRPGKGTHAAMRRARVLARQQPRALSCDIQRYFPSVSHEALMGALARVLADERLLSLIRLIVASHASAADWAGGKIAPAGALRRSRTAGRNACLPPAGRGEGVQTLFRSGNLSSVGEADARH